MAQRKRRNTVEVYFVLYLAALILLLPSEKEEEPAPARSQMPASLQEMLFSLQPEKTTLNCRILRDSAGIRVVAIDSTNTIFYTGNVHNVEFDFFVEDIQFRQALKISTGGQSPTTAFRVREVPKEQSVIFSWMPPSEIEYNRTLRVRVRARARLNELDSNELGGQAYAILQSLGSKLEASTQFTINIIVGEGIVQPPLAQAQPFFPQNLPVQPIDSSFGADQLNGTFSVISRERSLQLFPNQPWENTIEFTGIGTKGELKGFPAVRKENINGSGGSVEWNMQNNILTLRGYSARSGTMKVFVQAERKDGRRVELNFDVSTSTIEEPKLPAQMYPDIAYTIEPNLPLLVGQETRAVLRDESSELASSPQGSAFSFRPTIYDTGRVLILERYVNDKAVGQSYKIPVVNYPAPEIISQQFLQKDSIQIKTRSFGKFNGRDNRVVLEIVEGTSRKPKELYGNYYYDPASFAHIQLFGIRLLSDRQQTLRIRAIDTRGKASRIESIQAGD